MWPTVKTPGFIFHHARAPMRARPSAPCPCTATGLRTPRGSATLRWGPPSWAYNRRAPISLKAASGASDGARLSARQLKRALEAVSVDTSDCFERADLDAKWAKLSSTTQQEALDALASPEGKTQSSGASASSTAAQGDTARPSGTPGGTVDPMAWPREQLERLQSFLAEQQQQLASGSWADGLRARVEELDTSFNVGARTRMVTQKLRDAVLKADAALGVSTAARKYGPPLLRTLNDARSTPLGQLVWFLATTWLFLSGAFWTLLSWFFLASLLVNLVAPNWLQSTVEEAIASAVREAQQAAGGMGGGVPPPPPPGRGSASRPGSAGSSGGFSTSGRRDLSRDGPIVDVDAEVK